MDELEILITAGLNQNKSITEINKNIKQLEKKIEKLKLQATLDKDKSKSAILKEVERLNKQKRQLYVDLKLRKNDIKKQFLEIQKENNLSLNVDTANAQKQIKNVSSVMGDTKNETVGLGLALKNAFSNAGLVISAQTALQMIRKAASEATQAVKEYDRYATNLSVITGGSRERSNQLLGDLAEKSLDFKVDISDLEGAAETILRTGKSIDETNKYLENTVYLSKLGFQDMDTSASQLVTIGNAYGYTADEMSKVVDKFTKLDTSANITAGKLAEGVAKSAQNAKLAGFNIDQLSASIAGLKDTTGRSESEIANSLNMIFSRLQNVKLGKFVLETEDGTEGITQQINDTEKLLDTFGIKLRNSKNEFRDISELFTELSDNWSKFNSVQQSAIATTIAGARQRNTFIGLIENWNKIQELTDVSLNSMGTAVQKYDNYLNSIEAKSATLQTSVKELWNSLLPNDFVGNMTDAGTAVVQFTDKYQILQTAIKSATFYALAKGAIAAKNSLSGMVTDIKNVSYAMELATQSGTMTQNKLMSLSTAFKNLNDNQLKLVLSNSKLSEAETIQILKLTGLEEAEAKAKLQTLGLSQANDTATASTFSLSGAFKTLWATIAANPVVALTMAFTAFTAIQQTVKRQNEEMRESAVEAIDKYNEQSQALDDLRQKYIDICDSENSTAKKTEELNEWKKTLIETYGLEKEAIEQVNLAREDGLKLIDDEIIKNQINSAETWLTDNKKAYKDAKKKLLGVNNSTETSVIPKANIVMNIEKGLLDDYSENFDDILKQLTIKNPTKDNPLAQIKIQGSNVLQQYENLSKILNDITSIEVTKGLNKSEQELYDALLKKQAEYKKVVTDDMKDILENGKKYTDMIKLYNFQTDDGINFENVSADTYKEFRDKFLESLGYGYKKDSEDFSLDVEKILLDMLPDLENAYRGIEISDIVDTSNADEIKEEINSVAESIDDLEKSYDELSKSADNFTKSHKTLTDALKEQKEHGQLSADTIKSLSEAGYSQALAVDKETGAVTLNMEAYNRLNKQKKLKIKLDLEQQNTELETKLKEEESAISSLKLEYEALAKANAEANAERLKQIKIELAQHSQNKSELQNLFDKNTAVEISLNAPTFDTSSTKTDTWKEEAEARIAEIKHLYEMEQITYASYLSQLDKLNEKYFANDKKYLDDFRKYEEEIYKGRKKLNEDLIAEQEKSQKAYHDKRISELETQITVTTQNSVDEQGNKLTASEKFNYLRAIYDEILSEIERRENEIVQSGVEGHEDELEELLKQYENYSNKKADIFNDEIQYEMDYISELEKKYNDFVDKRIKHYENEMDIVKDRYDAEIKSIDDTIDALKDKNDETKAAIDLKKAEQDLENAKQRMRKVYGADGTVTYRQDTDKIEEAQQKADDLKLDILIDSLEQQKKDKETEKDAALEKYDTMIKDLEAQKESQDNFFDKTLDRLDNSVNPKPAENLDRAVESVSDNKKEADNTNQTIKDIAKIVENSNNKSDDNTVKKASLSKIETKSANDSKDNVQIEQTSNYESFMKLLYNMAGKEPDAYERYKRGEYDEGNKLMADIFSDDAFINRAKKPFEDAITSFNETITKSSITNIEKQQPVNVTFSGGINIQNPVGEVEQFAKELMLQLPTAFNRQIYTNLKY